MVLKKIGVMSVAKILGVMYATMGLLFGLLFAAVFSFLPFANASNEIPSWLGPMFGMGSIVALPIFYGVLGFIFGAIGAVVYNLFAGLVGGIVLHLEPAPVDRV